MIQEKIIRYFDGNPDLHVLFVFDQMGQIAAELSDSEWPEGYRYVSFGGDWFTVKHNLANDWREDKVVLLFQSRLAPDSQDERMDFPLYGEMKANMVYQDEDYLTFMQLKGIPGSFGPYIARHVGELQLAKYERILGDSYRQGVFSVDVCNRGLLSGYLGATRLLGWDDIIIRLVCMDGDDGDKDKVASFFRALRNNEDGRKALDDALVSISGVSCDPLAGKRMRRFAESLRYNSITQHLTPVGADDYRAYKISDAMTLQRLNRFLEVAYGHPVYSDRFARAVDTLAADIHDDKIFAWYGPDADYGLVTDAISWPILESIIDGPAVSSPVASNERLRNLALKVPVGSEVAEVIEFMSKACLLLEKIAAFGSFTLRTPVEYIRKYTSEFYLIDTYYRQCVGEFRDIPPTIPVHDRLLAFKKYIDEEYSKRVNLLNQEWMSCVRESGIKLASMEGMLHQQDFYSVKLRGTDAKRVVIISDALRYEVAMELLNSLGEAKHSATLEPALAVLPTETKYSKLALLPHSSLSYADGKLLVDGMTLETTDKKTAQVRRFEPDGLCIGYDDLEKLSREKKREIFKSRLVYILHDTIDSMSHGNPSKLSVACGAAVDDLRRLIPSLHASYNVANVYVTSDHGFLFNDLPFDEKDKHKVDDPYEERKTRYYITGDPADRFGVSKFRMDDVSTMRNDGKLVAVPNGSNRFNAESGGYQFAHGGATLQEMVIPVLYSHLRREDRKRPVGVTLLSSALTMVSSRLKFSLIQSDAVSEEFKERRVICGIYEGLDLLTAEREIVMDSVDTNPANRFTQVELTLITPSSGGILELRVYDAEDKDKLNPLAKAIVTNKTLIDQDF